MPVSMCRIAGSAASERARGAGPGIDLAERAEHRDDVVREIVGFAAGDQSAQHGEHRVRHERADLQRLVQQCDEEVPAAGGVQRLRNGARAKTVAIGLDHAGDRTGWMQRAQQPPVGDDGSEIDFQNRAGAVSRRHDPNACGRDRRSG